MKIKYYFIPLILIFLILFLAFILLAGPYAPQEPLTGPGSSDYSSSNVIKSTYGEGANQFWIYEPADPKPPSAPLIVFNHGWAATNPIVYEAWIKHLVKKGNIVIYPRYQQDIFTNSDDFTPNAIKSVKDGISILDKGDHVKADLSRFAIVGHSAGGIISINMAVLAKEENLPEPKAVFCVEPGIERSVDNPIGPVLENLAKVPSDMLLITLTGDRDNIVGNKTAASIYRETTSIPSPNKNYIMLVTDERGYPPLIADHLAPLAIFKNDHLNLLVNTMDYYGTWKLFDGLYESAYYGKNREYALGNTTQQRYMGKWSDGIPVKELIVIDNP
ncbi:MAG: alpha/beta hydrolase [Methanobacterium sp.]